MTDEPQNTSSVTFTLKISYVSKFLKVGVRAKKNYKTQTNFQKYLKKPKNNAIIYKKGKEVTRVFKSLR